MGTACANFNTAVHTALRNIPGPSYFGCGNNCRLHPRWRFHFNLMRTMNFLRQHATCGESCRMVNSCLQNVHVQKL